MTEIDRRALLGVTVTGAGLMLASCHDRNVVPLTNNDSGGSDFGDCTNWGELASKPGPGPGPTYPAFTPTTICCVYIVLEGGFIRVRHAYWRKIATMGMDEQVGKMMDTTGKGTYHSDIRSPIRIHDNFEKFGFNSKTKIYFFVDHDPSEFSFAPRGDDYIIRFTEFTGNDKIDMVKTPIRKNYAFYGLKKYDFIWAGWPYHINKSGYSLDFWNIDMDNNDLSDLKIPYGDNEKYYLYAMNIHLQMTKKPVSAVLQPPPTPPPPPPADTPVGTPSQNYLPIILDPDTGNMGGTP